MSKGRKLTRGENALWNKVAKTARPLPGRMESLLGSSADLAPKVPENSVQPPEPAKVTEGMRKALAAYEQREYTYAYVPKEFGDGWH